MDHPQISFQVRRDSSDSLAAIGERVGAALGCTFVESTDKLFEPGEALQASVLGLQVTLSADPSIPEGTARSYALIGALRDDLEAEWSIGVPVISISRYVLGVLTVADGEGWYIARDAELRAEAGLPAE
jgi:hypothetical protein